MLLHGNALPQAAAANARAEVQVKHENPDDQALRALLESTRTIAMVGASAKPDRPSNGIMRILLGAGFDVIPVTPNETEVLGRRAYASLTDIPGRIDIVDVFRKPEAAPAIAHDAVTLGSRALWLQLGVVSPEAAGIAAEAGLIVVMDMCIGQTVRRLGIRSAAPTQSRIVDEVEEAGRESFPASDPPAWMPPGSA